MLSIAIVFGGWPAAPAQAQDTATTLPSPLTPDAISALLSRLSDREVRDLLLQELGTRASEAETGSATPEPALVDTITQSLSAASGQIAEGVAAAPADAAAMLAAFGDYLGSLGTSGSLHLFGVLALALGTGMAADRMHTRWMVHRTPPGTLMPTEAPAFPASIMVLVRRLLRDAGGAILALTATFLVLGVLLAGREVRVGVSQVNDVGIVVAGKFMVKPEKARHFLIKREIYRRVQADFAAAGIHFARREVRVSVDTEGAPVKESAMQAISMAAAASEAAPDQKQTT